jgi:hypothetical protein
MFSCGSAPSRLAETRLEGANCRVEVMLPPVVVGGTAV